MMDDKLKILIKDLLNIVTVVIAVGALSWSMFSVEKFSDRPHLLIIISIAASAYAAIFSVYLSRKRERRLRLRRIFIIYSNKDRETATKIVKHLRDLGYNPWFDVDEISPGQKWAQSVMKGISESAVALLLVSKNLNLEKNFASKELETAMSVMRSRNELFSPIIPVRLDDSEVPRDLSDVNWVDLQSKDGFEQLERGLKSVLGQA